MKNQFVLGIIVGAAGTALLGLAAIGARSLLGSNSPNPAHTPNEAQMKTPPPVPINTATPAADASPTASAPPAQTQVIFNGRALTTRELQELEALYRTKARPGNYWYDATSGLFGVVGSAAAGFMYPGHSLGALAADASAGNTSVFINGRNITAQEVQVLSYLAGVQVLPGRYWLDARGNAGYEGNPIPVGNLFAAALARQAAGGGGGRAAGDNFWSSRFSAGNYNSDNSAGYVSLPGGGAVTYGF